ncbi:MAG: 30S ribosomal protein S17 [Planctomycetota bacterium]|jgi:small subunit ribosomal protein S17
MSRPKHTAVAVPEKSPRRIGVVESDRRDKTRTVVIARSIRHPKYGKYLRRRTVLHIHDENNESRRGDRVEIAECRPVSRTKRWTLVRIVERGLARLSAAESAAPAPSDSTD